MAYSPVVTSDKTCIYALIDPRSNLVRYIGKADNPKSRFVRGHLRNVRENNICHRVSWIRGLINEGLRPEVKILFTPKKENWQEVERQTIAHYRQFCNLVNMTDGGDGQVKGAIPWNKGKTGVYSKDVIKKMSHIQKERCKDQNNVYYLKLSPEKNLDIVRKFNSGLTVRAISEEYNVSSERIYEILVANGSRAKDRSNGIEYLELLIMNRFYTSFLTTKDIAKEFNVNVCVVSKSLKNSGVSAKKLRKRLTKYNN